MHAPLRVVFVAPFGLRQKTTVWARTLPLARELVAHGIAPTILIPPWDSPEDSARTWTDRGVDVVNVAVQGGVPWVAARLLRELDRRSPEIVHIIKPRAYAGIVHWLLWQRRKLGVKTPHALLDLDDWEQAWAAINRYPAPVSRFLAWQEEWGIRHADGITAASRWLVDKAFDYTHSNRILYLPNGVGLSGVSNPIAPKRDGTPTVLFFTRYVEVPPEWLAAMAKTLLAGAPGARLVIAGRPLRPDGDSEYRRAFAAGLSTERERVIWLGGVDPATTPGLLAASHLALFPASATPLQQAKCSVRLATTLLQGVPVVASAVGEQSGFGANGAARLVPADASPQTFAQAAIAILADPEARSHMVLRARVHLAANYQWPQLAATLAHYYATFRGAATADT